jgi:hypothetical protein
MNNRPIPKFFFLNGDLHQRIRILNSDDSVIAWDYTAEARKPYPRPEVRKFYKKAYTIPAAAKLINVSSARVKEVFAKGLCTLPQWSYDLSNYRKIRPYISEEDMLELRQTLYDLLPKNRFGEPHDDSITNEKDLIHLMLLGDDREFIIHDDGEDFIRIFRA